MPLTPLPVQSKAFKSAHYDADKEELHITFNQGTPYIYEGVPQSTIDSMVSAKSAGNFVQQNIRDKFKFRKW